VPVSTRQIELSELAVREVKVQEMKSVEAFLRLDAIASAGFRTSRSKIVDMVKAGDIR
jgi:RNA-binding protein YlmH